MNEIMQAVFASQKEATDAVDALRKAGFAPGKPCLIGRDTVGNYPTVTIQSHKLTMVLFRLALVGAFVGCLAGFAWLDYIPSRQAMSLLMVPLGGAFTGMALGFLCGMGFNQFARLHETPGATKYLGNVHNGDVAVSVRTTGGEASARAIRLLAEHGARHLRLHKADAQEPSRDREKIKLSKTA